MNRYFRFSALTVAALAVVACSGDTLFAPEPHDFAGGWVRAGEVSGSSEAWSLAVSGSAVTGVGQWTGEACCAGVVTVAGHIAGDSLHIDVSFFNGNTAADSALRFVEHVDAAMTTPDDLFGAASIGTDLFAQAHWTKTGVGD